MNITEREKKIFRDLLDKAVITEDDLFEAGYFETDIKEIESNRERLCLYSTSSEEYVRKIGPVIAYILGDDWKYRYDYMEEKRNERHSLIVALTQKEFEEICEAAKRANV